MWCHALAGKHCCGLRGVVWPSRCPGCACRCWCWPALRPSPRSLHYPWRPCTSPPRGRSRAPRAARAALPTVSTSASTRTPCLWADLVCLCKWTDWTRAMAPKQTLLWFLWFVWDFVLFFWDVILRQEKVIIPFLCRVHADKPNVVLLNTSKYSTWFFIVDHLFEIGEGLPTVVFKVKLVGIWGLCLTLKSKPKLPFFRIVGPWDCVSISIIKLLNFSLIWFRVKQKCTASCYILQSLVSTFFF